MCCDDSGTFDSSTVLLRQISAVCIVARFSMLHNWSNWFVAQEMLSPDASWVSSYSALCRGNASYLHHNYKCQRKFGYRQTWPLKTNTCTQNKCTQKCGDTTATRLSCNACVSTFRGNLVCGCGCVCLHVTQHFFLISQIGPGFCRRQRKQREGCCSVLCCVILARHT